MSSEEDNNSIWNIVQKLIDDVKKNEMQIQQLRAENNDLKKKIEDFQKEKEQMKSLILQLQQSGNIKNAPSNNKNILGKINYASLVENSLKEHNISLEKFNSLTINSQQIQISNIISSSPNNISNQHLFIFYNLLKFFDIYSQSDKSNYFVSILSKNYKKYIIIHSYAIQLLIDNKLLLSYNFNNIIEHFDEIVIELNYQSNKFDEIIKNIFYIKQFNSIKIFIDVFIAGLNQTGNIFQENKNVDFVRLDSSIRTISAKSFFGCSSLAHIFIPNSVTSIEDYSFSNCSSIRKINLPSSITKIGNCSFSGCESLEEITIPSSVRSIGSNTFFGCKSLKRITISPSLSNIGANAFNGCQLLHDVYITISENQNKSNSNSNSNNYCGFINYNNYDNNSNFNSFICQRN